MAMTDATSAITHRDEVNCQDPVRHVRSLSKFLREEQRRKDLPCSQYGDEHWPSCPASTSPEAAAEPRHSTCHREDRLLDEQRTKRDLAGNDDRDPLQNGPPVSSDSGR